MARPTLTSQLGTLDRMVRGLVRTLRRLAVAGAAGVVPIALLLRRDEGFSVADGVLTILLLAPAAVLLFFAQGVHELVSLPDRLRRMPGEGQERLGELARVAGQARGARLRSTPLLLWRLRRSVGSVRDLAGIALPLRVLAPPFLALAAACAAASAVLACVGVVALLLLALD